LALATDGGISGKGLLAFVATAGVAAFSSVAFSSKTLAIAWALRCT
jgi:hypothetical protein